MGSSARSSLLAVEKYSVQSVFKDPANAMYLAPLQSRVVSNPMTMVGFVKYGSVAAHSKGTCHAGPQSLAFIWIMIRFITRAALPAMFFMVLILTAWVMHGYLWHVACLNA